MCRSCFAYISACCLLFAVSGCMNATGGNSPPTILPVEVLTTGQQCPPAPESWTATWIASPDQLRKMISRCHVNRFGFSSKALPVVDFDRFGVLVVEMGQQRSAGYGFDTADVTASMENVTATVRLVCRRPAPGSLTAQMLTNPWIMIRLPAGPFRNIRVVDQNARFLAQLAR